MKTLTVQMRGIATNCALKKKCKGGEKVNYMEEMVNHIVQSFFLLTTIVAEYWLSIATVTIECKYEIEPCTEASTLLFNDG